jgi:hypothetical protein
MDSLYIFSVDINPNGQKVSWKFQASSRATNSCDHGVVYPGGESDCEHIAYMLSWTFQISLCGVKSANAAGLQLWRPVGDLRAN